MFSELLKMFGAAVFLFAVAALFWQWAMFAAFGALLVVGGLWLAEVYLRARQKGTEDAAD
jgi:hypothetical protein